MSSVRTVKMIIFPYGGFAKGTDEAVAFWSVVELCRDPVIIVNMDTKRKGKADAFFSDPRCGKYETKMVWSVDTCQMWLAGWGHILETRGWEGVTAHENAGHNRIVQLPGDIERRFVSNDLAGFIASGGDIAIGDFNTTKRNSAKELIDTYGTYPLLANWFPEIYLAMKSKIGDLARPRSEFLNIRVGVLNELLTHRKFAYEQTLNMLIRSYDWQREEFKYEVTRFPIGEIEDEQSFRDYEGCLDQIERTERLVKLVWREIKKPPVNSSDDDEYKEFIERYHTLDRSSGSIRESARITIRSLLSTEVTRKPKKKPDLALTNEKIAAAYPEWASFRGFSLLFDNPGNSLVPDGDLLRLECRPEGDEILALYKLLSAALNSLGYDLLKNAYSFQPLPVYSYHVTAWDGVNSGNLSSIRSTERLMFESYLDGLPDSVGEDNQFIRLIAGFPLLPDGKKLSLRFEKIEQWGDQVLVARLTNANKPAERVLNSIASARAHLSREFYERFDLAPPPTSFSPHISLGYFASEQMARKTESRIDSWNSEIKRAVKESVITFNSISLYGFTDMSAFVKAKASDGGPV